MGNANEFRVFGGPGTGKTTYLTRQIERAARKYGKGAVMACSFTSAAAEELTGRVDLPDQNVGTIHSFCYQALGYPELVEVNEDLMKEWNKRYPPYAMQADGSMKKATDEVPEQCSELMQWNRERAQMTGTERPQPFVELWEDFKEEKYAVDFTDLLLEAPDSVHAAVLFVDEAQDLTPLQWDIVRRWGEDASTFVVAGDDDQMLYSFLGADVNPILTPLPDDQKVILGQSYRLPRQVHEVAMKVIQRIGDDRQEKNFAPRKDDEGNVVEGEFDRKPYTYQRPAPLIYEIEERAAEGEEVMVLSSCGYMLRKTVSALRKRGLAFHNPYRVTRGDWNPLRSTAKRLATFLHMGTEEATLPYDATDLWEWVEMCRASETLQYGAKTEIQQAAAHGERVGEEQLLKWFTPDLVEALLEGDVDWLHQNMTKRFKNATRYPVRIAKQEGREALIEEPNIIVGTIHSIKGGEADTVFLFPDISQQAWETFRTSSRNAGHAIIRMAYVGMTRARRNLYICRPSSSRLSWRSVLGL